MHPPDRALVLCVDERIKPRRWTLPAPLLAIRPGQTKRRSHDYQRHGTTSLSTAFDMASGRVLGQLHRSSSFAGVPAISGTPSTATCRPT